MSGSSNIKPISSRLLAHEFYVYGSVHRWSIFIIVQRDATQSSLFIILQVHSTCFGCQSYPSSRAHKTVTTASPVLVIFLCSYFPPMWPSLATLEVRSCTPEAVVTVLCTPDDGCGWHPKHVQWICRTINKTPGTVSVEYRAKIFYRSLWPVSLSIVAEGDS